MAYTQKTRYTQPLTIESETGYADSKRVVLLDENGNRLLWLTSTKSKTYQDFQDGENYRFTVTDILQKGDDVSKICAQVAHVRPETKPAAKNEPCVEGGIYHNASIKKPEGSRYYRERTIDKITTEKPQHMEYCQDQRFIYYRETKIGSHTNPNQETKTCTETSFNNWQTGRVLTQ